MIPHDIKQIPGQKKHLHAVREYVSAKVLTEPLYITEVLMEHEPDRTMILMAIDGHVLNGGSPMVDTAMQIDLRDQATVRLMTVEESMVIKQKVRKEIRVPGTDRMIPDTKHVPIGNDVTVSHHVARELLHKYGHPVLDWRTKGGKKGHVVEVAWLQAEARKPDCLPELVELWERLKPRIEKGNPKTETKSEPKAKVTQ